MKLGEALTKYRGYRAELIDQQKTLSAQLKNAQDKSKTTGDTKWADEAATLQLSLDETNKRFEDNQEVLNDLTEQYAAAWNMEVAKQQSDPDNGIAAELGKIMTTVARMCAGDRVPSGDEKRVMEYDKDMYSMAKQTQTMMAAIKKRQKEYDTLWEEKEGKEYDPEGVAENTEAAGELPEIPEGGGVVVALDGGGEVADGGTE